MTVLERPAVVIRVNEATSTRRCFTLVGHWKVLLISHVL